MGTQPPKLPLPVDARGPSPDTTIPPSTPLTTPNSSIGSHTSAKLRIKVPIGYNDYETPHIYPLIFVLRKLESLAIVQRCLRDPTFIRFDTIPACVGRTDEWTDGTRDDGYTALAWRRAVKRRTSCMNNFAKC